MKPVLLNSRISIAVLLAIPLLQPGAAEERPIDTTKSRVTVRVQKAGALSAFGHNHEIDAAIASGSVDATTHKVELRFNASALKVQDPGVSEKDRKEIQETMTGPDVLDAAHYREIVFHSTSVEPLDGGQWRVNGELSLHGQTHPIVIEVKEQDGRYVGSARFRQTEFGIKPIRIAGGTIRTKDEIQIEFNVEPAH